MERRIVEGIEACRPGSSDLLSADMSDVARCVADDPVAQAAYQRVQSWDAAIGGAIEKVDTPEGLAERILARLQNNTAEVADGMAPPVLPVASGWFSRRPFSGRQISRRQWLGAASTIAATLLVGLFVGNWLSRSDDTSMEAIADGWLQQLSPTWLAMRKVPQGFEVPPAITAAPAGWQRIGQLASGRGVAFQLVHATAGTAKLFVVRLSHPGLPTAPPGAPQSTTGGKAVSYWQSGPLLYVLIVDGGERSYRAFVSTVPLPLA